MQPILNTIFNVAHVPITRTLSLFYDRVIINCFKKTNQVKNQKFYVMMNKNNTTMLRHHVVFFSIKSTICLVPEI